MKKISSKKMNNAIIAVLLVGVVLIICSLYYLYSANKFKNSSTENNSKEIESVTPSKSKESTGEAKDITTKEINYQITGLNKNDGDIFSIPDSIKFKINPNVDSSRIQMILDDGTSVYDQTVSQGNVDITIYPDKKLAEGSGGKIIINGLVGGKIVVTKEIKVIF